MLSTNLFLFLLLILPCSIVVADDSSSFTPQDLTYSPISSASSSSSSDADAFFQTVTDPEFISPEVLLAGSENNLADCQDAPPSGSSSRRTRRSRLRKRQRGFCSWQQYKSGGGAPTTQTPQTAPQNGKAGATTPVVPTTNKKDPADAKTPGEEKAPVPIRFGGAHNPEVCGPTKETIPVCHYSPERLGSSRWLSPTSVLIPVRLYEPSSVCMGLEETWCCSSTSTRTPETLDILYPNVALLYPLAGESCTFVTGRVLGNRNQDDFPTGWK